MSKHAPSLIWFVLLVLSGLLVSSISANQETLVSRGVTTIVRGPYLQMGTPSSLLVRWRTDVPTDSRVLYGAAPGNLVSTELDFATVTDHAVLLSGLAPDTRYYYAVGTTSQVLVGDDADHYFVTPPLTGTPAATRIWVLGDSGTGGTNAIAVRDAYYAFTGSTSADVWLMLGDNAYPAGLDEQYTAALFDIFQATLRQTVLWPTLGNHDAGSASSATESGPYYDIFDLPRAGESGGLASGTEAYYAFDHGNIHFVVLDSQDTDRSPGGAMLTWLAMDLAATAQDWIIAFWHHPPYSKGTHDSDTELRLEEMRANALPVLEDNGVDLVLTGHSHSYERSFLLDGHYGNSSTLLPGMLIDTGDGRLAGDGPYTKPQLGPDPHQGAVYTVAGSSGQIGSGSLDHPAIVIGLEVLGSVVLDIDNDRLDALFLDSTGAIRDSYTLTKGCADHDADGFCAGDDNCPFTSNLDQLDTDADGVGDVCDICPLDSLNDRDADGVCEQFDNCPATNNPDQLDADGDGLGDACDPCLNNPDLACVACENAPLTDPDADGVCNTDRILVEYTSADDVVLLEFGTDLTYKANASDPGLGLTWTEAGFDDAFWLPGKYGIGYEASTGAESLILTEVPVNTTSVYTRTVFTLTDLTQIEALFLGMDYDDGVMAWINGVEVYRSPEMPAGTPGWNASPTLHESSNGATPDYQPLQNISTAGFPALQIGENVLAIGVWNHLPLPSSDLVLVPRLSWSVAPQMSYLSNSADPAIGMGWVSSGFDATSWARSNYGVGYDTSGLAWNLITTTVPDYTYSIYTRAPFEIADVNQVTQLRLGADFDDGYAAWINGVEIYRSPQMPAGSFSWDTAPGSHESSNGLDPDYTPLIDVADTGIPALVNGTNILAVGVWNFGAPTSSDLILVPFLNTNGSILDNCPDTPNPNQLDDDADGVGNLCDCDGGNNQVWARPGPVTALAVSLSVPSELTQLAWAPPLLPGGNSVVYDVLRSTHPAEFTLAAVCVSTDQPGLTASDDLVPASGSIVYFLVRVENGCPVESTNMGTDSTGLQRTGLSCP
jgi:hypothetical protein